MAVYPRINADAPSNHSTATPAQPIDVEAWTEQATKSLNALTIVSRGARGTSVSLAIDLDDYLGKKQEAEAEDTTRVYRPRREPLRRDSLKRREALLKGKEGSRRRTRWENGSYHKQIL